MKPAIRGLRWYIIGLVGLATALNYLDRQTLSLLAGTIQAELKISTAEYSYITSAFLLSYMIMYAVSGRLIDRLGTRNSFGIFVAAWSLVSALHALAKTAMHFTIFRFLLGATEPANFPGGVKVASEWFPVRERALAVGIFNSGSAVGAAIAAPLVAWITLNWGWRSAFVFGGVLGGVWTILWLLVYRLPRAHPRLGAEELAHIESDQVAGAAPAAMVPYGRILRSRAAWGCIAARALTDPISYFFIFWTPLFLQKERGFDLAQIGKYLWLPFVAAALGNIAGGAVPGYFVKRGVSVNRARKTVMLAASCLMPIFCLSITHAQAPATAVALICGAMFCHAAWANMTLPAEVFPAHAVGSVSGLGGAMGALMGAGATLAIGWTVEHFSFAPVYAVGAFAHLTAFACVCVLVGELGRIRETI